MNQTMTQEIRCGLCGRVNRVALEKVGAAKCGECKERLVDYLPALKEFAEVVARQDQMTIAVSADDQLQGILMVPLGDPAVLHGAIAEALGEDIANILDGREKVPPPEKCCHCRQAFVRMKPRERGQPPMCPDCDRAYPEVK